MSKKDYQLLAGAFGMALQRVSVSVGGEAKTSGIWIAVDEVSRVLAMENPAYDGMKFRNAVSKAAVGR